MNEIGSYEAKTRFSELLKRVSRGEKITITRHGTAVAVLSPTGLSRSVPPAQVVAEIRAFCRGRKLGSLSIEEMRKEGRK